MIHPWSVVSRVSSRLAMLSFLESQSPRRLRRMCDDKSMFPPARILGWENIMGASMGSLKLSHRDIFLPKIGLSNVKGKSSGNPYIFGGHGFLHMSPERSWANPVNNSWCSPCSIMFGASTLQFVVSWPMTKAPTCMPKPDPPKCQGLGFVLL